MGDLGIHTRVSETTAAGRPPVVFVHGVVSSRYLLPTADRLARTHRVVVLDLPGFGHSPAGHRPSGIAELADAVAHVLEASCIEQAVVVGHSIGAQVAVELACRRPEYVRGLVLAGPTGDPSVRTVLGLLRRWLATSLREPLAFNALALRELVGVGPRRMIATARAAVNDPFVAKLAGVAAPALVVRGEYDGVAPADWAERVREGLGAAAPLEVIDGVAHSIVFSAPRELASLIARFCEEIAARESTEHHDGTKTER